MADEEHLAVSPKGEYEVRINVDSMAASFDKGMSQNLTLSDKRCIFRVPHILRRHNEKAYIPSGFAIGPWHRNRKQLKTTEKIKLKYLHGLLSRPTCRERRLKVLINAIAEVESEAREYYAGPINVDADKFVEMLVLDGCFLIELFRKYDNSRLRDADDPIFNTCFLFESLHHDLILLENQIPWLVLERLFNMTTVLEAKPLVPLVLGFFGQDFSIETRPPIQCYEGNKHILDLLRYWLIVSPGQEEDITLESVLSPGQEEDITLESVLSPGQEEDITLESVLCPGQEEDIKWQLEDIKIESLLMPSATKLLDAGVKFKRGTTVNILDIKFIDGVLEIPCLMIQETTEAVFRSLISYEQCAPNCSGIITSYAILLDKLINTSRDMDILSENRIIDNWLNPEDATQYFNKLYLDTYVKTFYYGDLCENVNRYCELRWPRWRAMLMRNHFGNPWAIASLIAAITLLILTIVQTVFSILK